MIDFSRSDLVIPVSGWVQNIESGRKCQHGVYIPSTQEDKTFADYCDICLGLRAFLNFYNITLEIADMRLRMSLQHADRNEASLGFYDATLEMTLLRRSGV